MTGFKVIRLKFLSSAKSSSVKSTNLNGFPHSSASFALFSVSNSFSASLSLFVCAFFAIRDILPFIISKSDIDSSKFIISISLIGSISFSTWIIFSSSKHLTT